MNFVLGLKIMLTAVFFAGAVFAGYASSAAKRRFKLQNANFGAWPSYKAADIRKIMAANGKATVDVRAAHFVCPILFPIDLLLLTCAGAFLGMLSLLLAEPAGLSTPSAYMLLILPILYIACDLTENCLLARMLLLPDKQAVTEWMVASVCDVTRSKLLMFAAAVLQIIVLLGFWVYWTI
jgi:hypothetical protein